MIPGRISTKIISLAPFLSDVTCKLEPMFSHNVLATMKYSVPFLLWSRAHVVIVDQPLIMFDKWLETNPKDIVWKNLDDGAVEMRTRYVISWAATFGLILLWTVPVAFVGTLSRIDQLCANVE